MTTLITVTLFLPVIFAPFPGGTAAIPTPITAILPTPTATPATAVLPPTQTPAPTPLPSPTPLPPPTFPLTKGVAGILSCDDLDAVGAGWWYGWTPWPRDCPNAAEMAMVRDLDQFQRLTVTGTMAAPPRSDARVIVGANEPDLCPDQGCATPEEWLPAERWIQEFAAANRWLIGSPAPSQADKWWLSRLRDAYVWEYGEYPHWDFLAIHCYVYRYRLNGGYVYDNLGECQDLVLHYLALADEWGVERVVVSETAAIVYRDSNGNFQYDLGVPLAQEWLDWLDAHGVLWAWYTAHNDEYWGFGPNATTQLLNEDGTRTPLGDVVAGR